MWGVKNVFLLKCEYFPKVVYASIGLKLFGAALNCWIDYYMYYGMNCWKVEDEIQKLFKHFQVGQMLVD